MLVCLPSFTVYHGPDWVLPPYFFGFRSRKTSFGGYYRKLQKLRLSRLFSWGLPFWQFPFSLLFSHTKFPRLRRDCLPAESCVRRNALLDRASSQVAEHGILERSQEWRSAQDLRPWCLTKLEKCKRQICYALQICFRDTSTLYIVMHVSLMDVQPLFFSVNALRFVFVIEVDVHRIYGHLDHQVNCWVQKNSKFKSCCCFLPGGKGSRVCE